MEYNDLQLRAFSAIAYMNLTNAFEAKHAGKQGTVPLSELLGEKDKKKLRALGIEDSEFNQWKIRSIYDRNDENGFYSCIIETSPGSAAVAFRGSESMSKLDNTVNDWIGSDLKLVNSICTQQHGAVRDFFEEEKDILKEYEHLTLTGHSLGGNLAEYGTIISSEYGLDSIIDQCVNLDGPGFSNEFIDKYKLQIEKMKGKMKHYRWSLVGSLLFELPGVEQIDLKVSNDANKLDKENYSVLTRHDTKYLETDGKNFVKGEQEKVALTTSYLSKQLDKAPAYIGDTLVDLVSIILICGVLTNEAFKWYGKLTPTGKDIVKMMAIIFTITMGKALLVTVFKIFVAVVVILFIINVVQYTFDTVLKLIDNICDEIAKMVDWVAERLAELKDLVASYVKDIQNWFNNNFNKGYKAAIAHPQVVVDTYKLRSYADRLQRINQRVASLDRRLDSLYWQVGLAGLWNLVHADLLTNYSRRVTKCSAYLTDTAVEFEQLENSLMNGL